MEKFKTLTLAQITALARGIWAENRGEPLPNAKPHETSDLFAMYALDKFGGEVKDINAITGSLERLAAAWGEHFAEKKEET